MLFLQLRFRRRKRSWTVMPLSLVRWTQWSRIPAAKKRSVADNFLQKQQKQRAPMDKKGPRWPSAWSARPHNLKERFCCRFAADTVTHNAPYNQSMIVVRTIRQA